MTATSAQPHQSAHREYLRKVQAGRGVNTLGEPEIPRIVFEELLVNALVHRDYFISAPIRLFVFADRIEIISPGHLPNHLTIEKIKAGNSNIRNPILASFVAKGLLPYRGLGTGIRRAFEDWEQIETVEEVDDISETSPEDVPTDPEEAMAGADVVNTDVWASMGQEDEQEERMKIFAPYQVNSDLMVKAPADAIVLHCLPAHREEEITEDVLESDQCVAFDQAENKMHMHKAILEQLIG